MDIAGRIPFKTPAGYEELKRRTRRLSQRHRTMLLLVDGRRSAAEIVALAGAAGVAESCFDELVDLRLIGMPEPSAAASPVDAGGSPAAAATPTPADASLPPAAASVAATVDPPVAAFGSPSALAAAAVPTAALPAVPIVAPLADAEPPAPVATPTPSPDSTEPPDGDSRSLADGGALLPGNELLANEPAVLSSSGVRANDGSHVHDAAAEMVPPADAGPPDRTRVAAVGARPTVPALPHADEAGALHTGPPRQPDDADDAPSSRRPGPPIPMQKRPAAMGGIAWSARESTLAPPSAADSVSAAGAVPTPVRAAAPAAKPAAHGAAASRSSMAAVPQTLDPDAIPVLEVAVPRAPRRADRASTRRPVPTPASRRAKLSLPKASRTKQPPLVPSRFESTIEDAGAGLEDVPTLQSIDGPLEQAREVLIRAVRAEAPITGQMTLMKLKRVTDRAGLEALLGEVELRISRPRRKADAAMTLRRVRRLLDIPADTAFPLSRP